jgi:hypothetical protein
MLANASDTPTLSGSMAASIPPQAIVPQIATLDCNTTERPNPRRATKATMSGKSLHSSAIFAAGSILPSIS